jgi:hypothetical protein
MFISFISSIVCKYLFYFNKNEDVMNCMRLHIKTTTAPGLG